MAERIQGIWDVPGSRPVVRISPPASEAEVAELESETGTALPPDLREGLTAERSRIDIPCVLCGRSVKNSWGWTEVAFMAGLPEHLQSWSRAPLPDGTMHPRVRKLLIVRWRTLSFGLSEVAGTIRACWQWHTLSRDLSLVDMLSAELLSKARSFMSAGFPVMTTAECDWLAIAQRHSPGRMLHVEHSADMVGIELDPGL